MAEARYGHAHRRARAKWADLVAQGGVECCELVCLKSSRLINPDEPWHLAHTPDGDAYLGPAHAECNTSEGARRGNRTRISPSQSQIEGSIPLVGDAHYPAPASHPSPRTVILATTRSNTPRIVDKSPKGPRPVHTRRARRVTSGNTCP